MIYHQLWEQVATLRLPVLALATAVACFACGGNEESGEEPADTATDSSRFGRPEFGTGGEGSSDTGGDTDSTPSTSDTDIPDTGDTSDTSENPIVISWPQLGAVPSHDMVPCDSCVTLADRIRTAAREALAVKMLNAMAASGDMDTDTDMDTDADMDMDADGDGDGDSDWDNGEAPEGVDDVEYTETNTQERDVDEADIVKTDGDFLYVISNGELVVVDVLDNGGIEPMGRLPIGGVPVEMMLYRDLVVVFSSLTRGETPEAVLMVEGNPETAWDWDEQPEEAYTLISLIDASNRASLSLMRSITYSGQYVTSRRVGDALRVVISSPIPAFQLPIRPSQSASLPDTEENFDILFRENAAAIDAVGLDQILPRKLDVLANETAPSEAEIAIDCEDAYAPVTADGIGLTTVVSLALDYPLTPQRDVAIVGDAGIVYASSDSLYLATDRRYVMSAIQAGLWAEDSTGIHKFDIATNRGMAIYQASGTVPGHLLNQFCLGDQDGFLRVATSTGSDWATLDNHLRILTQNGEALEIVGTLDGIGQGEDLYAARFIGNRGFMVTWRNWDPLFTFDLTDPYNPRVVGQWEGPGYSTYLHPFGENHLIALGEEDGWAQISLYDLTNFAAPSLVERLDLPGYSFALYDHKAFTFFGAEDLAVLPYYSGSNTGVAMYTVAETGLTESGTMSFGAT